MGGSIEMNNEHGPDQNEALRQENLRLKRALEEVSILNEIARAVSSTLSLDRILDLIVKKCVKHLGAEQGTVLLLDNQKEEKPFQTMIRGWGSSARGLPYHLDAQLTGWMLKHCGPLLSNNFAEDHRFQNLPGEAAPIQSLLCVPLLAKARMIGVLCMFNRKDDIGFNEADQRLLSIIATQSAQSIETARLLEEEQRLRHIQEELRLAYEIQTNLLPTAPPQVPGYDVAGRSIPAKVVGGDYYDFIPVQSGDFAFCLGDVSGKGMPAALLMSNLQAAIRSLTMRQVSIPECLALANNHIFHNSTPEKFVTFFYASLNTRRHRLAYANAGHNHPLLIHPEGSHRTLETGGLTLGCMEGVNYEEETFVFSPGERLVIYSDGISEAMNAAGDEFGEERLLQVVKGYPGRSSADMLNTVFQHVEMFTGNVPQMDDMTLVVIQRFPEK